MTREVAKKLALLLSKEDESLYDEIFSALDKERTKVHSIIKTPSIMKLSKLVAKEDPYINLDFLQKLWRKSLKNEKELSSKVIIGGAPLSMDFCEEIGADSFGVDAMDAVGKVKELMGL